MFMSKKRVGKTDLEIGVLGLGCAPLGGNFVDLDYDDAAKIIKKALAMGISYFDTAPWYGFGRSERVVGDHIRHKDFVLSSKVGRILKPGAVETRGIRYGRSTTVPRHL